MDKFGVPKKINRHVIRAVYALGCENENSDLLSICDEVKFSMKNNVPVPNLLSAVRKSLLNLSKLGILKKRGTNYYYKCNESENMTPRSKRNENRTRKKSEKSVKVEPQVDKQDNDFGSFSPKRKRKRMSSDESNNSDNHVERSKLKRQIKHVPLLKLRKHINFQTSNASDEVDDVYSFNSFDESGKDSEDENPRKRTSHMEMRSVFPSHSLKSKSLVNITVHKPDSSDNSENFIHRNDFNTLNVTQLQSTIRENDEQADHQPTLGTQEFDTPFLLNGLNNLKEESCESTFLT